MNEYLRLEPLIFIQYLSLSFHGVKGKSSPKGILYNLTSPSIFNNVLASQRDGPAERLFRGVTEIYALSQRIPLHFNKLDKRKICTETIICESQDLTIRARSSLVLTFFLFGATDFRFIQHFKCK